MIELHYWPTPNGHKVSIFLEEAGLPYKIIPVALSRGDQFKPDFLAISPNNRIPAIIDKDPADGGEAISVFESGAILVYLAAKTGRFMPRDTRGWVLVMEWLCWQVSELGPMLGQNHHFAHSAPERLPYAIDRYIKETARLYAVINKRLAHHEFMAGDYSIADMACYPWIVPHARQGQNLDSFPHLKRWFEDIRSRSAVVRAYEKGKAITAAHVKDDAGSTAKSAEGAASG